MVTSTQSTVLLQGCATSATSDDETILEPVERAGRAQVDVFRVVPDDETLSVGDTTEIEVRLRESGTVVVNATQMVTVEEGSRSFDCES